MFHRHIPAHARPKMARKKRKWLMTAGIVPLLIGGAAYAYFTLDQATSHVNVASSASDLMISIAQPTGTPLSPGVGTETVLFSVVNTTGTVQTLNDTTYALTTDAVGGIYDTNTNAFVDTCQASWFTITGDAGTPLPLTLNPGAAMYTGSMTVTMPADPNDDQNSCSGLAPQVVVSVS